MKRIIPKSSKVKMEIFKGLSLKDLILGIFLALTLALTLLSNLHNKFIYVVIIIFIAILIIPMGNGHKLYEEFFAALRFVFSKKKFVYKYAEPIHKKEKNKNKIVNETVNLSDAFATQLVSAGGNDETTEKPLEKVENEERSNGEHTIEPTTNVTALEMLDEKETKTTLSEDNVE